MRKELKVRLNLICVMWPMHKIALKSCPFLFSFIVLNHMYASFVKQATVINKHLVLLIYVIIVILLMLMSLIVNLYFYTFIRFWRFFVYFLIHFHPIFEVDFAKPLREPREIMKSFHSHKRTTNKNIGVSYRHSKQLKGLSWSVRNISVMHQ